VEEVSVVLVPAPFSYKIETFLIVVVNEKKRGFDGGE
jgi:hypothetical protein